MSTKLNCKKISTEILQFLNQKVKTLNFQPKISILLPVDENNQPMFQSQVYVSKKIEILKSLGIETKLVPIDKNMSKSHIINLVNSLNADLSNNGTFVQLPFATQFNFQPEDIIENISEFKDIDGLNKASSGKLYTNDPIGLKPATALGICNLITYYDIKTSGRHVVVIGKGKLSGKPLANMLMNYPFNSTVTICDVFSHDLKDITNKADILITACGKGHFIKPDYVKQNSVLIDVGINQNLNSIGDKNKIIGDICPSSYSKSRYHTTVPGGVGLLTTSSLAFNVVNACYLQAGKKPIDIYQELYKREKYYKLIGENFKPNSQVYNILLFSSCYNGMTQNIEKTLKLLGHRVSFEVAKSDDQMRKVVNEIKPDFILCPFLKKAIPKDIYKSIKCLIVHPGIKGDRGPSSLDWAILNNHDEWGVTIIEADEEMDAGNIWATENFKIPKDYSKLDLYNSIVLKTAKKLVLECISKFQDPNFKSEPLNYNDKTVKGNLHRTLRISDPERSINWELDNTKAIMKKIRAGDSQPGVKAELIINGEKITQFLYGVTNEAYLSPPKNISVGEIFSKRGDAVCIKTQDGSIWVSCLRSCKTKTNPYPIKLPSCLHLKDFIKNFKESEIDYLTKPDLNTYQETSFEKNGNLGILYFNFYNGAMDTQKCNRLVKAIKQCSLQDINVLILAGSETNWSNGIHLNVIENSNDPKQEAWENIKAINNVVKEILLMKNIMTISAIQSNAGAGGVYMGMATDFLFGKPGIVFNPHYKKMGLYGSELHTFTAPRRIGKSMMGYLKESARPIIFTEAIQMNIVDDLKKNLESIGLNGLDECTFFDRVKAFGRRYSEDMEMIEKFVAIKKELFNSAARHKTMLEHEEEELKEMYEDFFNDRNGFDLKRKAFIRKVELDCLKDGIN